MKPVVASRILEDCKSVLNWLENEDQPTRRRILWVASISMLRAIGDALDRDPEKQVRRVYQAARLRWKDERGEGWDEKLRKGEHIFFDFILHERNKVNHEYEFGHTDDQEIDFAYLDDDGELKSLDLSDVYWPMKGGPYEGVDARDMLQNAIEWWECEFKEMGLTL